MTDVFQAGLVKICSLREPGDAALVIAAGADAFGLIFAEARRQVMPERAAEIVREARRLATEARPTAVGVFVDASAARITAVAEQVGLDLAQLHGDEPPELLAAIPVPAVKAIRPKPGETVSDVERAMARYLAAERPPVAFLVDGYHPGQHGGVGARADWGLAAELAARWPVILAGGLNPANVGEAIEAVQPIGVDVSSGVETDGAKDGAKIAAFVAKARRAFVPGVGEQSRGRCPRLNRSGSPT